MQKRNSKSAGKISSFIGPDLTLEGIVIKGSEGIRVDGTVIGDMEVTGCLVIGEKGKVAGNITGTDLWIAGTVDGNICCTGQIYLSKSSSVHGDITYGSIVIDEGAKLNGKCNLAMPEESARLDQGKHKARKDAAESAI